MNKEKSFQENLDKDIKYTLNDMTSYGLYNGISEFDISTIVSYVKEKLNSDIWITNEEIAKILTEDAELKEIAEKTYIPYPENNNWADWYKEEYRNAVKNKTAKGYGIIPNNIIKEKIEKIILSKIEQKNKANKEKQDKLNAAFELARKTGERQLINKWTENCNNPKEECNLDVCEEYAMPDGTLKVFRSHTW